MEQRGRVFEIAAGAHHGRLAIGHGSGLQQPDGDGRELLAQVHSEIEQGRQIVHALPREGVVQHRQGGDAGHRTAGRAAGLGENGFPDQHGLADRHGAFPAGHYRFSARRTATKRRALSARRLSASPGAYSKMPLPAFRPSAPFSARSAA